MPSSYPPAKYQVPFPHRLAWHINLKEAWIKFWK
eukprot:UN23517